MTADHSLRDEKRAATGHALALAAFELAVEQGLDGFTIEDIAGRAGYSRRTFANHFAGKEEAVVAGAFVRAGGPDEGRYLLPRLDEVLAACEDSGGTASDLLDAIEQLVRTPQVAVVLRAIADLHPLVEAHRSLRPFMLDRLRVLDDRIHTDLPRGLGTTGEDLKSRFLIGAVIGILGMVTELGADYATAESVERDTADPTERVATDTSPRLEDVLSAAFGYLRHGFSDTTIDSPTRSGELHTH